MLEMLTEGGMPSREDESYVSNLFDDILRGNYRQGNRVRYSAKPPPSRHSDRDRDRVRDDRRDDRKDINRNRPPGRPLDIFDLDPLDDEPQLQKVRSGSCD